MIRDMGGFLSHGVAPKSPKSLALKPMVTRGSTSSILGNHEMAWKWLEKGTSPETFLDIFGESSWENGCSTTGI